MRSERCRKIYSAPGFSRPRSSRRTEPPERPSRSSTAAALCCADDPYPGPWPVVKFLFVYEGGAEGGGGTGLPAVLALWVARRDVATPQIAADFLASKNYGLAHIPEIASQASEELQLPEEAIVSYLRDHINFDLDAQNLAGLERYYQECAAAGLLDRLRPLELVHAAGTEASRATGVKQ